ncbi:MAG: 4-hydroxythreonine-4-phosphate dehydrogenase PdxA [Planctomycetota bacterium]
MLSVNDSHQPSVPRAERLPLLALTMGDSAGIGPELLSMAVQPGSHVVPCMPLLIGNQAVLQRAARHQHSSLPLELLECSDVPAVEFRRRVEAINSSNRVACCDPTRAETAAVLPGVISAAGGDAAFRCLELAAELALSGHVDAIVTAPLNKEALHLAGHRYPGHTEILAERCGVNEFAMMLHLPEAALAPLRSLLTRPGHMRSSAVSGLSIAHVTLHTSVASVPRLLTPDAVAATVRLMHEFLGSIRCPRRSIAVCALNPHGGEHGLFGDEESRVIERGIAGVQGPCNVHGPLPADTVIRRAVLGEFDGIVAMYHDQGHIPVKLIGFDAAINVTLGLPIIRTSPTHGTAFDIAWQAPDRINPAGFLGAMEMASRMVRGAFEGRL